MTKPATWLLDYKKNVYSQRGEDGVIEKILQILPHKNSWCVEFGAWDGKYLSNTCNLIENHGYSAVLIEGDRVKFADLKNGYLRRSNVVTINSFVGFHKDNSLDTILEALPIPQNFDLLSIDIDGNDYHVWKTVVKYRPKVVCVEFNPTIPIEVKFVQPADLSVTQGASLSSLVELGKEKQYELVAVLPWNAIFVDVKYFSLLEIEDNRPETLWINREFITYLFSGYDGTVFLGGLKRLVWHPLQLSESKIQHLPKLFRKYPDNYSKIQQTAFSWYLRLRSPRNFLSKVIGRVTRRTR